MRVEVDLSMYACYLQGVYIQVPVPVRNAIHLYA